MAGLFGMIISGVQVLALERQALVEVEWTASIVLFTLGYALRCAFFPASHFCFLFVLKRMGKIRAWQGSCG